MYIAGRNNPMKKLLFLLPWCILHFTFTQAQFLKKAKPALEEDGDPLNRKKAEKPMTNLSIGGDESVTMDSSFEFDVAVYQETVAYQGSGNQQIIDGGEQITIYYSNVAPQYCVQLESKSTGARYHFYVDFSKDAQLSITAVNHIGSGEKEKLDLAHMEPVYPGEGGYLNQLMRTGGKKVIAGVACEEYVAQNTNQNPSATNHSLVTAHVWIPMEPSTLFHGYGLMPDKYKAQIEQMRIEGSYPPVVVPLEMFMQYGNGDKVYTYTTDIIVGEKWKVNITDINK
jgi:hypothetical protein